MAKLVVGDGRAVRALLTLKTELWQSIFSLVCKWAKALLTLKTELWQSSNGDAAMVRVALLTLKTELWQSILLDRNEIAEHCSP